MMFKYWKVKKNLFERNIVWVIEINLGFDYNIVNYCLKVFIDG